MRVHISLIQMGATPRKTFWKWIVASLAILLLGLVAFHYKEALHFRHFSAAKLWNAIRSANYVYLVLSVVTIYACYAVRSWRWQRFQTHVGQARFANIYAMNLAGFSALFLLGRVAEPIRPLLISRKDKIPIADTFGIYALERILDAASTAVLAAVGLLVFESSGHMAAGSSSATFERAARTAGTFFSIGAIVAIGGLVYLRVHGSSVLERRMQGWLSAHGWRAGVARSVLGFSRGVQTIRTWSDMLAAIALSGIHWLLVVLCYYLVTLSFGGKLAMLSFADAMLVLVFTMVGSAVQLPGIGGGAQALSIFAFTRLYGVEQEPAVAAALVLWLVTFAACSLAGVPLLAREGLSLRELRRMREHEDEEIDAEIAVPPPAR
ncbi:MAG TPA: lysylphosphatidylglycerol synthase transmembrane domain-containing protein [Candidatus Acidoferrum sp.]